MSSTDGGGRPDSHKRGQGYGSGQPVSILSDTLDNLRTEFERRTGPRMGQRDVRVAILTLLDEEPMHGYQIIQEIEKRSEGAWEPTPGSIYPALQLLTDEGIIGAQESEGKKIYSLTKDGNEEAQSIGPAPWETTAARNVARAMVLPKAAVKLAQAVGPIASGGTIEQVHEAVAVIDEARRKIYAILAQD